MPSRLFLALAGALLLLRVPSRRPADGSGPGALRVRRRAHSRRRPAVSRRLGPEAACDPLRLRPDARRVARRRGRRGRRSPRRRSGRVAALPVGHGHRIASRRRDRRTPVSPAVEPRVHPAGGNQAAGAVRNVHRSRRGGRVPVAGGSPQPRERMDRCRSGRSVRARVRLQVQRRDLPRRRPGGCMAVGATDVA